MSIGPITSARDGLNHHYGKEIFPLAPDRSRGGKHYADTKCFAAENSKVMDSVFGNPERVARFTKECLVTDFGFGASGQNIKYMVFIFMDVVQKNSKAECI